MHKTLVAGFIIGLLSGCMNTNNNDAYNRETAERKGTFRYLCENEKGVQDETPAMDDCMSTMARETPRKITSPGVNKKYRTANNQMNNDALFRKGMAMYSCGIYGTIPDPVTGVCSPPPPRQTGDLYDNSGRHIGTYVEN